MSPELLQSLTAAKGLPMPIEEGVHVDHLAELMKREKRLRELLHRLKEREDPEARAAADRLQRAGNPYFDRTATGRNTKSMKQIEWTHAECAQACQGLGDRYFEAMRYTYALDDSVFHRLHVHLFEWTLARREREPSWPTTIVTQDGRSLRFVRDLVDMWLLEVRQPWRFLRGPNEPDLRRVLINVNKTTWQRRVSPVYEAIAEEFVCWLAIAASHMRPRLREDEAERDAVAS